MGGKKQNIGLAFRGRRVELGLELLDPGEGGLFRKDGLVALGELVVCFTLGLLLFKALDRPQILKFLS